MNKVVFSVVLAICVVLAAGIQAPMVRAQTVIEATKVVRLHDEIGRTSSIPIVKYLDLERQGQLLALGGDDHIVRLWDVQDRRFIAQLREHSESVRGVAFSPNADRLATVSQDGQIHIWNVQNNRRIHTLRETVRGMRRITFQPDGTRFAVCGFDQNIRIYDAQTYRLVATLPAHGTNNEAIVYSNDGTMLAVGGRTGVVRIWRTADNSHLTDIKGDGRRVRALAFSPDDSQLATGGDGPFIMLWSPQNGRLIRIFAERPGKTFALVFCGSDMLASGESDNMVRLWNPATGTQTAILSGHTGTISTMTFVPQTQKLVTGSFDASVRFWTLPDKEIPPLPMPVFGGVNAEPMPIVAGSGDFPVMPAFSF